MSDKITFAQLVEELSDEMIIPKTQSQDFINALVDVLLNDISAEGKAALTNFGSFKIIQVSERTGVNPKTGEEIIISAHNRLSFTPYKALEKTVNRDFEHLEVKVLTSQKSEDEPEIPKVAETIIQEKESEIEPDKEDEVDDPFNLEEDLKKPDETEQPEETVSETESTSIGTPGFPEKKGASVSTFMILGVVAVFIIAIIAVWFFIFREVDVPQMASSTETTNQTEPPKQEAIPMIRDEELVSGMTNTPESQVIPMVDSSADFADNPAETMTLSPQSQDNQTEITITFSVSSGVWIYEIARQTYGNTRLWPLIFQANFTLDNNPDKILPNVNLKIPRLEGTTENPTASDYARLAQAARYVADAYEFAGNETQATAYRKAADWYEKLD